MKCLICYEIGIMEGALREHLEQHNPNARGMEFNDVCSQFTLDPETQMPVCRYCGSADIRKDADAVWNLDTQEWELNAVYDSVTCQACGEESKWTDWKEGKI